MGNQKWKKNKSENKVYDQETGPSIKSKEGTKIENQMSLLQWKKVLSNLKYVPHLDSSHLFLFWGCLLLTVKSLEI